MLWLNPSDNQGVRFLIDEVRAKLAWEERRHRDRNDDPEASFTGSPPKASRTGGRPE